MNSQTESLIRELADKMGTTVEHLWGVLVFQAAVSGVTNLLVMIAWVASLAWVFRFVQKKTTKDKSARSEWEDDAAFVAWAIFCVTATLVAMSIGLCLSDTIGALVNPEYWALKQVLPGRF